MVMNHSIRGHYIPPTFRLEQNNPNPFYRKTTIRYHIPHRTKVIIMVFNSDGYILEKYITKDQNAGVYKMDIIFDELPAGTYFYQMITDKFTETRSMDLQKQIVTN